MAKRQVSSPAQQKRAGLQHPLQHAISELDPYLSSLSQGGHGTIIALSKDKNGNEEHHGRSQVKWHNGSVAWYCCGEFQKCGELGFHMKFHDKQAQFGLEQQQQTHLEVYDIDPNAEDAKGERLVDLLREGDQIWAIDGVPVQQFFEGKQLLSLRERIDLIHLGPEDSEVFLEIRDEKTRFTLHCKRQLLSSTAKMNIEFGQLDVDPRGMYHLEIAKEDSFKQTSWLEFKQHGVVISNAKVEFYQAITSGMKKEYHAQVKSGKRVILEGVATEDCIDFFKCLAESCQAQSWTGGHHRVKLGYSTKFLVDFMENHYGAAEFDREAESRYARAEIQRQIEIFQEAHAGKKEVDINASVEVLKERTSTCFCLSGNF
jgi:hypothetical protein